MNLSSKQKKLLEFIRSNLEEKGFPPTFSEMAETLGVRSKNAIAKMLHKFENLGLIDRDSTARGIRLLNPEGEMVGGAMFAAPIVGAVAAGSPILAEENIETWVNLPTTLVRNRKDVRGESMHDAGILDGDLVIVSPSAAIRNRDIVVALLQDEATVKRYIEISGRKYLKAENAKYKNIYPKQEWRISGKVVGVIRQIE